MEEKNINDKLSFIKLTAAEDPTKIIKLIKTYLEEEEIIEQKPKNIKEYSGRQKIALLIIIIGDEANLRLFDYLREDEIETIIFEVTRKEYVTFYEKEYIINEVYNLLTADQFISIGGLDYARKILEQSLGSQKAIDILNRLTSSLQVKPFDFIRRCDPSHLLNFLQQEHPQVISLVLSYLEPNKSSCILQNLPHELQPDVARRIACMDRVSPEILREVERVLEKKLSTLSAEDYICNAGGIASIVEILNLVDRAAEKQIIEALEDEDPELAEEIKKRMFIFEDIVMLDDRSIQKIMREIDSQELAKALFSVDHEVQNKIFRNMSKRAANMLREDMEYMGPIRLKDVEECQQKIVSIARHLEDTGEIVIARCGEDELIEPDISKDEQEESPKLDYNRTYTFVSPFNGDNIFIRIIKFLINLFKKKERDALTSEVLKD